MKDELITKESSLIKSQNILNDLRKIISNGRKEAYLSVSQITVITYWNVGKRIVEEEQNGKERAEYGQYLLKNLSEELTKEFVSNTDNFIFALRNFQLRTRVFAIKSVVATYTADTK